MVFCTECGTEITEKSKYCSNCGNLLEIITNMSKVVLKDTINNSNSENNLICPVCLSKSINNNSVCSNCGTYLKETLFYFEGSRFDMEITPTSLIKYNKSRIGGKRTGKIKTYDRNLMENVGIALRPSELWFKYEGKLVKIKILKTDHEKVMEVLEGRKITLEKTIEKDGELQKTISNMIITPVGGIDKHNNTSARLIPEQEGLNIKRKDLIKGKDAGEQFIRYEDIISIGYAKGGLITGTLTIMTLGGKIKLSSVHKKNGVKFVSSIQEIITSVKSKTNESSIVQQQISPMEEIKKAKKLLDNGIITEEEFNKLKNKYLT